MHEAAENREPSADAAPEKLVSALRSVAPRTPFIPPVLDEAVLRAARRHLAPGSPRSTIWLAFLRWGAATAALCVCALLVHLAIRSTRGFAREDINHDSRIDILDAFALAQNLRASNPAGTPEWDVNRDGVADQADVRAVAMRAVALQKEKDS